MVENRNLKGWKAWRRARAVKKMRRQADRAAALLKAIDATMIREGVSRQERRAFWAEFARNTRVREEFFGR